jgi:predicted double-glycine peptidase
MIRARIFCGLLLTAGFGAASESAAIKPLEVPFFRQAKNGCGAASVAMVAHYWAGRLPNASSEPPALVYRRLYDPKRRGIPLAGMKDHLAELGYRAFTFRGEWKDLEEHLSKGRPVIVGLRKGRSKDLHFVVLTGAEDRRVRVNDPTRTRPSRMKKAEFEKQWGLAGRWILLATP